MRSLGVEPGDVLMVHASLRAIGPVEGGAAGVVEALDSAVGPTGTLIMTLGAQDDWDWVNERPEAERAALLDSARPFQVEVTPADPDVGVLAEVFRRLPGTLASDHPDGRFGARGRLASLLLSGQPWDDYYGPGSPLDRLVDAGGKVLRLGADSDTVTLIHFAEYKAVVPDKRRVVRHHKVLASNGTTCVRSVSCLDDSDGIAEWPGEDYFTVILRDYLALGRASTGTIGTAQSELIDAGDLVEHAAAWMTQHFGG
jgi:aminoglycoside N3'-acetyltransferase